MQIEMRDGLSFIDEVIEVRGLPGGETVVFADRQVISVQQIEALTAMSAEA